MLRAEDSVCDGSVSDNGLNDNMLVSGMFIGYGASGRVQRTPPIKEVRRTDRSLRKPTKYPKDGYLIYFYVVYPFDNG